MIARLITALDGAEGRRLVSLEESHAPIVDAMLSVVARVVIRYLSSDGEADQQKSTSTCRGGGHIHNKMH